MIDLSFSWEKYDGSPKGKRIPGVLQREVRLRRSPRLLIRGWLAKDAYTDSRVTKRQAHQSGWSRQICSDSRIVLWSLSLHKLWSDEPLRSGRLYLKRHSRADPKQLTEIEHRKDPVHLDRLVQYWVHWVRQYRLRRSGEEVQRYPASQIFREESKETD